MNNSEIAEKLVAAFGEELKAFEEPFGLLTFSTGRENIINVLKFLNENGFSFLTDITGIHLPDNTGGEFGVIYHVHNLPKNIRIRIKVFISKDDIHIPTATVLYEAANWMERETFDFYGIIFDGHPNLKRILNMDDMDYFPMRKEYALEDATREDKIDALFGR